LEPKDQRIVVVLFVSLVYFNKVILEHNSNRLIILASRNSILLALHRPVAAMACVAVSSVSDFGDSV